MTIIDLVKEAHENAVAHGWWEQPPHFGTLIALCHSELSEALEESRTKVYMNVNHYTCTKDPGSIFVSSNCALVDQAECALYQELGPGCDYCACPYRKPEGIPAELADTVIRIADMCGHYGIDLDRAIAEKMAYNRNRPYKHGGKAF